MTTANVYLNFNGNCRDAFKFYQEAFGGEFQDVSPFADMPPQEGMPPIADEDKDKLMHISLPLSENSVLMGCDMIDGFGPPHQPGNNFAISLGPSTKEEADKIFKSLSHEGEVTMPMEDTFWGSYFGSLTDKFGISRMINVDMQGA